MRKSNFALWLEPSLLDEARKVAEDEGVALNQAYRILLDVPQLALVNRIVTPASGKTIGAARHTPSFVTRLLISGSKRCHLLIERAPVGFGATRGVMDERQNRGRRGRSPGCDHTAGHSVIRTQHRACAVRKCTHRITLYGDWTGFSRHGVAASDDGSWGTRRSRR